MIGKLLLLICALALLNSASAGNSDPSQAAEICAAKGSDGILVAHEDCSKFYKCSEGKPAVLDCPGNLLYNPDKEYCDWPQNVNCKSTAVPEVEESDKNEIVAGNNDPNQARAICSAPNSDGVLVAHDDCSKFYECSGGKPTAFDCPLNLLYNPEKEFCDWPGNVNCNAKAPEEDAVDENEEVSELGNSDPSQAAEICAAQGSDGILVAHEDCRKFYKCSEGKPAILDCPGNLLYNPEKEYCDWPQNVNCKSTAAPEVDESDKKGNSDPSQATEICAAKGSDGILVAHEICSKFYKCSEGKPAVLDCPGNLVYNPDREYCDWPQNVDCGDRT